MLHVASRFCRQKLAQSPVLRHNGSRGKVDRDLVTTFGVRGSVVRVEDLRESVRSSEIGVSRLGFLTILYMFAVLFVC